MSSAAECTFHVANFRIRGLRLELREHLVELLETDGIIGEVFSMCGVLACFEEFCGAIVLALSDQLIASDVI